MVVSIKVPVADIFHKLSVLSLKIDADVLPKTCQVRLIKEADYLLKYVQSHKIDQNPKYSEFLQGSMYINNRIWELEKLLRELEISKDHGPNFVQASRDLFYWKDKGFKLRQLINKTYKSHYIEQKILPKYPV